ncbi:MAG: hypothetical protein WAS23_07320 [Dokdonella sp.]|uniref:hypothetical protein n=1 Tax=Dokdonella sp. TaxID=2291710 RepID=UPI002B95D1DB|nr:hypothetical protein [Dokdonella sp.]HOX71223.1 hypothetical protein [Dokdonella sp.]HPG95414.1 hypothetical protein [Dokdonella sp.]HPN78924.1 hypothetical protein [Dokdonella sp.]
MRCVERTCDYLDGLALVALLRANDLDAHLFDENFVRLDWLQIFAYGGFRVMVPLSQLEMASGLAEAYRTGALRFAEEECDHSCCPQCSGLETEWNPRPRDWVRFVLFLFGPLGLLSLVFGLGFTHRLRCRTCHHRWRERPVASFGELQSRAEGALNPHNA